MKMGLVSKVLLACVGPLIFAGCSDIGESDCCPDKEKSVTVKISSLDDLIDLFEEFNYTSESWATGNREVPRMSFEGVSDSWRETSQNIPVSLKKEVFFKIMAPLVLMSNENIEKERMLVKRANLDSHDLKIVAEKYGVIATRDDPIDERKRQMLLKRVDIIPASLALAQAAEESGWATSRFTQEGNAFFGQWDFSGNGMLPKQQRKAIGSYGLARFPTPLASVEGYMFNINTAAAYRKLRTLRADLRLAGKPINGLELVGSLDRYSERGPAYIKSIRALIHYNNLTSFDEAYLADNGPLHLTL